MTIVKANKKMPLHVVVERSRHSKVKLFCLANKGKLVRFPDDISSPDFKDIYRLTAAAQESPPAQANNFLKTMRRLFERALKMNLSIQIRRQETIS